MGEKCKVFTDIQQFHPEVTGSKTLCVVHLQTGEKIRFLVDFGLFEEKEYAKYNEEKRFNADTIDFVLITHVHVDHVGLLPYLCGQGYRGPIYCTNSTAGLMPIALADCYKVLSANCKHANTKCIYSEADVAQVEYQLKGCEFNKPNYVHPNVKVTFFQNGHLFGAAMILVQISDPGYEDINLFFTGDYNKENVFFDVEPLPDWVKELPLTLVQEATYGDMDSTEIEPCFKENVLKCLERHGTVVALVFSLGRSQEILYELKKMQEEGVLSTDIPIYLDGKLGIKYTNILATDERYGVKKEMIDFLPKNLTYVFKDIRMDLVNSKGRKIILTSSGMGSYGPAQIYIPHYIQQHKALIQFTGYCADGTLGAKLQSAAKKDSVTIGSSEYTKLADVEYTTEFSAHAKADEMIEFLKQFKDLKAVLVNHGETDVKITFAERIKREVMPKYVGIPGRDYVVRVGHYGVVKTLPTKFD